MASLICLPNCVRDASLISYDTQHIMELAYGHGALPRALWNALAKACGFPCAAPLWTEDCASFSEECSALLNNASAAIGDFNIYNFVDNCGDGNQEATGVSSAGARRPQIGSFLDHRARFGAAADGASEGVPHEGGQEYPCGTGTAATRWCNIPSVREALHMHPEAFYGRPWALQAGAGMHYTTYTGASYDLYPEIVQHIPVLIYNGDVDACVPYNSNADWIDSMVTMQGYRVAEPWRPWMLDRGGGAKVVSGYVTSYATAPGPFWPDHYNLTFLTIKDSGHMVPQYQPDRALAFFTRWLDHEPY